MAMSNDWIATTLTFASGLAFDAQHYAESVFDATKDLREDTVTALTAKYGPNWRTKVQNALFGLRDSGDLLGEIAGICEALEPDRPRGPVTPA